MVTKETIHNSVLLLRPKVAEKAQVLLWVAMVATADQAAELQLLSRAVLQHQVKAARAEMVQRHQTISEARAAAGAKVVLARLVLIIQIAAV